MARQARRAATATPGGSLRGLVFDACFDNRIPNTFGLLQHFGMSHRNKVLVSESPHLNVAGLATALRIDESEILDRRYPAHGRGHRSFYGLLVLKTRIEDEVRRFSPAAIAAGVQHHPATHELRDLPFSTIGWDVLQDRCPCVQPAVRQLWTTVNGVSRCQSCGGSLGRVAPIPVPDDQRASLAFIAGLVDPAPGAQQAAVATLPAAIRAASRTLLYDMIMNLTSASIAKVDADDPLKRSAAMARACEALLHWPDGLAAIQSSEDCPVHRWEWVCRNYPMLGAFGHVPAKGSRAPAGIAVVTGGAAPVTYAPSGSAGKLRTGMLSQLQASRLGAVDAQALKEAWDMGKFTQHVRVHRGERSRGFDPAEVLLIAPQLRVVSARGSVAMTLGLPQYGVEQLLALQLLNPEPPAAGQNQRAVHLEAARTFVDQCARLPQPRLDRPIKLVDAMRHVSGRAKPWGPALGAILAGDIACNIHERTAQQPVARRLIVDASTIPIILQLEEGPPVVDVERAGFWRQADALECLNGNKDITGPLDGLAFTGVKRKLYRAAEVLARAAAGVTTADVARRSGHSTERMRDMLMEARVPQVAPCLWVRERAEALAFEPPPLLKCLSVPPANLPPAHVAQSGWEFTSVDPA